MALLASDAMNAAAVYLNDPNREAYNYEKLLPMLNRAYEELERKLLLINSKKMEKTTDDIAGPDSTEIDITNREDNLLDDMIRPIDIYTKGADGYYGKITEWNSTPAASNGEIIENALEDRVYYWEWQGGKLRFNRNLSGIVLKIRYYAQLRYPGSVEDRTLSENSPIIFPSFYAYLAYQCAGLSAEFIMENPTRAASLYNKAIMAWDEIRAAEVKEKQSTRVRRRRFRGSSRIIASRS